MELITSSIFHVLLPLNEDGLEILVIMRSVIIYAYWQRILQFTHYKASNGWIIVNNQMESAWREATLICIKVSAQRLLGERLKRHTSPQDIQTMSSEFIWNFLLRIRNAAYWTAPFAVTYKIQHDITRKFSSLGAVCSLFQWCNKNTDSRRAATVAVECRSLFYQHTASSTDLAPCHSVYS